MSYPALSEPELVDVERNGASLDERSYTICANNFGPLVRFHGRSIANLERAVMERVFYVKRGEEWVRPPTPQPDAVESSFRLIVDAAKKYVRVRRPVTPYEFADMYRGMRRTRYFNAATNYINHSKRVNPTVTAFVKIEKVLKRDPCPRVIQARNPEYNVALGRFIKPLEHDIYRVMKRVARDLIGDVEPVILKGFNAVEQGQIIAAKWGRFRDPVGVGLDAHRFDQHVSLTSLRGEHQFYRLFFRGGDLAELTKLLQMQEVNTCYGRCPDGKIKYRVVGNRMSGDMNTGLGNCVIMCTLILHFLKDAGVTASIGNNGDDCFIILEREDLHLLDGLPAFFLARGFELAIEEPVDVLEKLEFCQSRALWTPRGYTMVRNVNTALAKDHSCTSAAQMKMWVKLVGECGMAICQGIPVMQEVYQAMCSSTTRSTTKSRLNPGFECGFLQLARGLTGKWTPVDWRTRVSFYDAFGILPDEQLALEASVVQYHFGAAELGEVTCPLVPGHVCAPI